MATSQTTKSTNGSKSRLSDAKAALAGYRKVKNEADELAKRVSEAARRVYELTGPNRPLADDDGVIYRAEQKQRYEMESKGKHKLDANGKKIPKGPPSYQVRRLGEELTDD